MTNAYHSVCYVDRLAYAELYITTAALFSTFDFQLVDTTRDDVTLFRYASPFFSLFFPSKGYNG